MNNKAKFYRIYLNCRRGFLELDIILLNFLELEYFNLNKSTLKDFNELLKESDQDLYLWLVKREKCNKDNLLNIIFYIKKVTDSSHFK